MKKSTLDLYSRVLKKIDIDDLENVENRIDSLSSDSYKILAYKALHHKFPDYDMTKYKKLIQLQNNKNNVGVLPMTLDQLLNIEVKCSEPLQQLVESFTIWLNTHHPLRLDYYNVRINPADENCVNYMTYDNETLTFYLNDFKNVSSFGKQVITYSDPIICNYLTDLTKHFGKMPEYLLYRYDKPTGTLMPFSSRIMYGGYLQDLFKKHTGHHITMNTIRKIHESALIQSPEYSKMTNQEKQKKHNLLLHSMNTAIVSYNVVQ